MRERIIQWWGADKVVSRGRLIAPADLDGWVVIQDNHLIGALTYELHDSEVEIVTINADLPGKGIGSDLIKRTIDHARNSGCRRVWLITTNDNLNALRFYQRRGLHLAAIYPNALEQSRKLKPQIPEVGSFGIPLRDEIELEVKL